MVVPLRFIKGTLPDEGSFTFERYWQVAQGDESHKIWREFSREASEALKKGIGFSSSSNQTSKAFEWRSATIPFLPTVPPVLQYHPQSTLWRFPPQTVTTPWLPSRWRQQAKITPRDFLFRLFHRQALISALLKTDLVVWHVPLEGRKFSAAIPPLAQNLSAAVCFLEL